MTTATILKESCMLLDAQGNPFPKQSEAAGDTKVVKKYYAGFGSYMGSLFGAEAKADNRIINPYVNHAWVYAAATVIAITASQAPFTVFIETKEEVERRKLLAKEAGRAFRGGNYGKDRRVSVKYINHTGIRKFQKITKSLRADYDHPLMGILANPNPMQDGSQLQQVTHLFMTLNGEAFWLPTGKGGNRLGIGEKPSEIWPIPPQCVKEILRYGGKGDLVGWRITTPHYLGGDLGQNSQFVVSADELIQFKRPNPYDPIRGLSTLSSLILSIKTDLLTKTHNLSLIKNDAVPKGIVMSEYGFEDASEEETFKKKWSDYHSGEGNTGRTAFLQGGEKYIPIGLSPQDMQFMELYKIDRQEVLSGMGVPPSSVGLSEFTNYATAVVQDNGFWNKTILPMLKAEELGIERSSLMQSEPDTVVGLYDVTDVEALRAGIKDKIAMAQGMCTDPLHAPPRIAFEVVGLEVPEYEADDKGFVSLALQTVDNALIAPPANDEKVGDLGKDGEKKKPVSDPKAEKALKILVKGLSDWHIELISSSMEGGDQNLEGKLNKLLSLFIAGCKILGVYPKRELFKEICIYGAGVLTSIQDKEPNEIMKLLEDANNFTKRVELSKKFLNGVQNDLNA